MNTLCARKCVCPHRQAPYMYSRKFRQPSESLRPSHFFKATMHVPFPREWIGEPCIFDSPKIVLYRIVVGGWILRRRELAMSLLDRLTLIPLITACSCCGWTKRIEDRPGFRVRHRGAYVHGVTLAIIRAWKRASRPSQGAILRHRHFGWGDFAASPFWKVHFLGHTTLGKCRFKDISLPLSALLSIFASGKCCPF
jgi:hypothetical protein